MTPPELFELLRAQVERRGGTKTVLEPQGIHADGPMVRLNPGRIVFRRESQGDWVAPVVHFSFELELGAKVEGTGLGFRNTIAAAYALMRLFSDGDLPLEDAQGARLAGGASFSARPLEDARFLPQEEPERFFEYVDRWAVILAVPYQML